MRPFAVLLAFAALGLTWWPASAGAQAIRGVVLDDTNGQPVTGATVRLLMDDSVRLSREADDEGRFLLPVPWEGGYAIEVARLGYETARSQFIPVARGDTVEVEFYILPDAVLLDPLTVTGNSNAGRNLFARRQAEWGEGFYLGPEYLDSIAPEQHIAEVFRGLDKVRVSWGWGELSSGASGPLPGVRTYMGRGCLLYMVDRVPVRAEPWVYDDWASYQLESINPEDVQAIEFYRTISEVPPELRRWASQSRVIFTEGGRGFQRVDRDLCGLVVLWTKAGW